MPIDDRPTIAAPDDDPWPAAGGHGYGKDNRERATFTALGFAFLKDRIGWLDARA